MPKHPANKKYSPRSVIAAQRRVLRLCLLALADRLTPGTLYAFGTTSLWTTEEILDHIQQVSDMKVDYDAARGVKQQ